MPANPRSNPAAPLAALLAVVGGLALTAGCRRAPPAALPPPVVLFEIAQPLTEAETQRSHTYLGMVRGEIETDLSFRVGGLLESIGPGGGDWREGDGVTNGQEVARLQQADFQAAFRRAQAQADYAGQRWTNNHQLFFAKEPAISRQEWEKTDSEFKAAQAEREREAQALQDSRLFAPFTGRILARLANPGEMVPPGRTVLRLAKVQPFVAVELGVPDRVITQIQPGQSIPVRVSALDWTNFTGVVREVGAGAKEGSRLFRVVLNVRNDRDLIKSGMTASVTFAENPVNRPGDVLVRLSALVAASARANAGGREDQLAVFVVGPDNRVHERPVETGDIIRSSVVVSTNLNAGDRVVVVGASQLRDGQTVDARPVPREGGSAARLAR